MRKKAKRTAKRTKMSKSDGPKFIDSHMHCGVEKVDQPIEKIIQTLGKADIDTCCLFAPVEDIYDRYDFDFVDNEEWIARRKRANHYLLNVSKTSKKDFGVTVYPYLFVWNDFDVKWPDGHFRGIKWHRHPDEPRYEYKSTECEQLLHKVYKNKLPIVYEEEFENTKMFAKRLNGKTTLIIPHLGGGNGGYEALKKAKIWDLPWVYADLAMAGKREIIDFVKNFGADKLLWGSDWPFGSPVGHIRNIQSYGFKEDVLEKICHKNIQRLMDRQFRNR